MYYRLYYTRNRSTTDLECSGSSVAREVWSCPVHRRPTLWNWCSYIPQSQHWNLHQENTKLWNWALLQPKTSRMAIPYFWNSVMTTEPHKTTIHIQSYSVMWMNRNSCKQAHNRIPAKEFFLVIHGYHIYKSEVYAHGKTFLCVELVTVVRPEITLRFVHCFSNWGSGTTTWKVWDDRYQIGKGENATSLKTVMVYETIHNFFPAHLVYCTGLCALPDTHICTHSDITPLTNGGNSGNNFAQFQLVQDSGLARGIQTNHQDSHFLLPEEALEKARECSHPSPFLLSRSTGSRLM